MHLRVPLPREGFNKLLASIDPPLVAPAPITVWISSINKTALSFFCNSLRTAFNLSSKSPLYLVPASRAPISSEYIIASSIILGTFFSVILFANPSAIAVFPTPGSPTNKGLFFCLLHKI